MPPRRAKNRTQAMTRSAIEKCAIAFIIALTAAFLYAFFGVLGMMGIV